MEKKTVTRRLSGAFNMLGADMSDSALLAEFDRISLEVEHASQQTLVRLPSLAENSAPDMSAPPQTRKFGFSEGFVRRIQSAPVQGRCEAAIEGSELCSPAITQG